MKKALKIFVFFVLPVALLTAGGIWWWGAEPSVATGTWLRVPLGGELPDRVAASPFEATPVSMLELRLQLRRAAKDERIAGVVLDLGHGGVSASRCEELTRILAEFRDASGKPLKATAHAYDLPSWIVASHTDEIVLDPVGRIDLRSAPMMVPFLGGALRKFGIEPDIIRHGDHKAIYEQFANDAPSEALQTELTQLHHNMWSRVRSLSGREGKTSSEITAASAGGSLAAESAKSGGWVDRLASSDKVLAALSGGDASVVIEHGVYGRVQDSTVGLDATASVAILSVEGTIAPGDSGTMPVIGRTQGISALRRGIAEINATPGIKGVIVRVESPGGDAFTSEQIWRALQDLRKDLPVVAWMGSQATSGGYYTAVACEWIYCLPSTMTGSIGIVGLQFRPAGALEMLGVKPYVVAEEGLSQPSPWAPHTVATHDAALAELEDSYHLFVDRVREGRGFDEGTALAVANGRAMLGDEAETQKLVDGLGGWSDAWQKICEVSSIDNPETATAAVFPRPTPWWSQFVGSNLPSPTPALELSTLEGVAEQLGATRWFLGPLLGW